MKCKTQITGSTLIDTVKDKKCDLPTMIMISSRTLFTTDKAPSLATVATKVVVGFYSLALATSLGFLVAERQTSWRRYQLCDVLRFMGTSYTSVKLQQFSIIGLYKVKTQLYRVAICCKA